MDDVEDPTIFKTIPEWLAELDMGPRGVDGQHFAQYGATLTGQGYFRIFELADMMTVSDLQKTCPRILPGVMKSIIHYARMDVKKVQKKQYTRGHPRS